MNSAGFRAELLKVMPGYKWTVRQTKTEGYLEAEGIQSKGFNRISTIKVIRREQGGPVRYEARSAGYGKNANWLHTEERETLASALRALQEHYEHQARLYRGMAASLQAGRVEIKKVT